MASQDYSNIEHIIVDGASTDGTLEILKQYDADIISEKDAGICNAFNKGLGRASGEFIHTLNADDKYMPEAMACRMVAFMVKTSWMSVMQGLNRSMRNRGWSGLSALTKHEEGC